MGKGKGKRHLTMNDKLSGLSLRVGKIFKQYSWCSKEKTIRAYWTSFTVHSYYVETEKIYIFSTLEHVHIFRTWIRHVSL